MTRKSEKIVLGRNRKKFNSKFWHQNYYILVDRLITRGLITFNRIAIDSTFIEVFGKEYQKARFGWGKKKTALGYRLSVAFDLDSKLSIAYIITFGSVHDSQHLILLVEMIKSKYGIVYEQVVVDRASYGQNFFTYLTANGIELVIPVKKYSSVVKVF